MMKFEKSTSALVDEEEAILNSNSFFNLISKDKEVLKPEDILESINQSERIGACRYLIKDNQDYVGIIEYLFLNPNDQCTWLGLLVIKKDLHSKGYGTKALEKFYEIMKEHEIEKFRIGVIAENELALRFWMRQGFQEISRTINNDNKEVLIFEKSLV